ncbi:hypothetical protein D3C75_1102450 [compost metagenome]
MVQQGVGTHFGDELVVAAHAEDQLNLIHPRRERIHHILAEHEPPASAHNEYGRDIGKPQLLAEQRLVGTFPELRMHRDAGNGH